MTNNKYTANITLSGEQEKLFLSDHEQGRIPTLPILINIVLGFPATAISYLQGIFLTQGSNLMRYYSKRLGEFQKTI